MRVLFLTVSSFFLLRAQTYIIRVSSSSFCFEKRRLYEFLRDAELLLLAKAFVPIEWNLTLHFHLRRLFYWPSVGSV